jgi:hypothetical protein
MTIPYPDFMFDNRRFYAIDSHNAYEWFKGATGRHTGEDGPIYEVQVGPYAHLNFVVFALEYEGLEHAIEAVAGWLADNAPGSLVGQDEMDELYDEAARDLFPKETAELEEGVWWHDVLSPKQRDSVREQAEADLMYTESGYLTSYEIHFNEVHPGTPLFGEAFNYAMFDYPDGTSDNVEAVVDEIEEEEISPSGVLKILKKLGVNEEDCKHIWTELIESDMFSEDYMYFSNP